MKRIVLTLLCVCLVLMAGISVATATVEPPESCETCGMSRPNFAKSRMLITYEDHSTFGTCSIACASEELAKSKKKVTKLQVGDYVSGKLIDAKSAVWVINTKKRGIMSPVAKWAFTTKSDADTYIKKNGGKVATWDEALKAAAGEKDAADAPKASKGCEHCNKKQ